MSFSCNDKPNELNKYKDVAEQLEYLLSPSKYANKDTSKTILVTEVLQKNDPVFTKLMRDGIINDNSRIFYSSNACISLITRIKGDNTEFTDYVVTFNRNEGNFICNINDIYTLNQDENVDHLHIGAFTINSFMTLSIVDNK